MSTIFADKFKNTSGGNPVQINQLRGIDTAGSIAVQGEGTNTTNLQQGLNKVWVNLDGAGTFNEAGDSFNVTSLNDGGTGHYGVTYTNVMSNALYCYTFGSLTDDNNSNNLVAKNDVAPTTSVLTIQGANSSGNADDANQACATVNGDLA